MSKNIQSASWKVVHQETGKLCNITRENNLTAEALNHYFFGLGKTNFERLQGHSMSLFPTMLIPPMFLQPNELVTIINNTGLQ